MMLRTRVILVVGFLAASPSILDAADRKTHYGATTNEWRTRKDVAQFAVNVATIDIKGAIFKFFDIVLDEWAADDAAVNAQEMAELKAAVRALQVRSGDFDALADRLAKAEEDLKTKATRQEVADLIRNLRGDMRAEFAALERKVDKNANEIELLKGQYVKMERKLDDHERRLDAQSVLNRENANQLADHAARLLSAEQAIRDHEKRISELERKFAYLGVAGFEQLSANRPAQAVQRFDEALAEDPTEPAFYYGKALALLGQSKVEEAKRVIRAGARAELQRRPGKWYRGVLSSVQGRDRILFEDMRLACMPVETVVVHSMRETGRR